MVSEAKTAHHRARINGSRHRIDLGYEEKFARSAASFVPAVARSRYPRQAPVKDCLVPRYFTHLYNSEVLCDESGQEFIDLAEARVEARASASELIAEHIVQGITVDLNHRLEVMDEDGQVVFVLTFAQLFGGHGTAPVTALI